MQTSIHHATNWSDTMPAIDDCVVMCPHCMDWRTLKDHCAARGHYELCRYCKEQQAYDQMEDARNS